MKKLFKISINMIGRSLKRDRRLRSKQIPTMESFFDVYASYDRTTWNSVEDMMNDIEDEHYMIVYRMWIRKL